MSDPILHVEHLAVDYRRSRRVRRVVDDVAFEIPQGQSLGLVGESGSGKTTIGNAILGLVPVAEGTIRFKGEDISRVTARRRRELTRDIQVVFQDPYGSLNPSRSVGSTLADSLMASGRTRPAIVAQRVNEALEEVGLPATAAKRYPAEFSGGQRQRIAIARALISNPELIVCDEAVSALDLSIQAQVLNLLADLRASRGLSLLFITHDLAVVAHLADHIAVLERGRIVEQGPTAQIMDAPRHAYTRMLLAAAPTPDPRGQQVRRQEFHDQRRAYLGADPAQKTMV